MRNIKKIFIVVFSLILLFAVSCSNDDKTGISNNPPENDTEITDGETGSGSSSGGSSETGTGGETGDSGSGSETGGSGTGGSGTETGGGTGTGGSEEGGGGSGTGTGGDSGSGSGTGGSGSGSGSGEGGGGTVTPPSETETIEEGYFPPPAGNYIDDKVENNGYIGRYTKVSEEGGTKTRIEGIWIDGSGRQGYGAKFSVSKWKKTTKGGRITKTEAVEIVDVASIGSGPPTFSKVIYDYETKTLSGTCKFISSGTEKTCSFNGKLVE